MTVSCADLEFVNAELSRWDVDLRVKPVTGVDRFFWLHATDDSYALKVTEQLVQDLHQTLRSGIRASSELSVLFDADFPERVKSPFKIYGKRGFTSKDYGEFYVEFEAAAESQGTYWLSIEPTANPDSFIVGDVSVRVSLPSPLMYLLNVTYEDDVLYDTHTFPTIKLKGTSASSVEDDLWLALYYLHVLTPSSAHGVPRIVELANESDIYESDYFDSDYTPERRAKVVFPRPSHVGALRYFFYAESLPGEEAILYYYKVLEYFFEWAWSQRVVKLVAEWEGQAAQLATALQKEQPRNDEMHLRCVLRALANDRIWRGVSACGFSDSHVESLAKRVYLIRNKVAHGGGSGRFDVTVPSLLRSMRHSSDASLLRMLAREAVVQLCGAVA